MDWIGLSDTKFFNSRKQKKVCSFCRFYFLFSKDEIKSKLLSYGLSLGNVVKRPIDKLVQFHSKNKKF